MSDTPSLGTPPLQPASRGRSTRTIIVAVALSVAATLAIVCLVLQLLGIAPWSQGNSLVQRGEVASIANTGTVVYDVPFASQPQVTVNGQRISPTSERASSKDGPIHITLVNQNEQGFSWEFSSDGKKLGASFRWEAQGRGRPGEVALFVQKGSFLSVNGEEGQVHFPHRYETPPNVEIEGGQRTIIVESNASSFKWKNTGTKENFAEGTLTWVAKGVKAK